MKQSLLRTPRGAEIVADAIRVLSAISILVAGIGWGPSAAVSVAGASLIMLFPRMLGVRPFFDIAFCVVTSVATWSAVLDIYHTVLWWDIPMHFALNGLVAALAYLYLIRVTVLTDPKELPRPILAATVIVTALGLSFGVLWEFLEWFVKAFIDSGTLVGYEDTLGDLVAGGLGAVAAGLSMRFLAAGPRMPDDAVGGSVAGLEGASPRQP